MSKELLCTIASAGNCPYFNIVINPENATSSDYRVINFDEKYTCEVCMGKDSRGIERDCIEIEKLNLLSKLANK